MFAITFICEKIDMRLPGALIAIILASLLVWSLGEAGHGIADSWDGPAWATGASVPHLSYPDLVSLLPLALIVALVVMIQTAATSRSFPNAIDGVDINRDLLGVGFGNILSGLFGGFAVNRQPAANRHRRRKWWEIPPCRALRCHGCCDLSCLWPSPAHDGAPRPPWQVC